ncbi:MAG: cobyrinate a,c-diamide synthase [Bacteroidetes bacterium]|nr:cobyrinate a,c-diamide synthase [Bacteroidota bacterium]
MNSQFLLAAPHSGAGKTTVTLGLLRALLHKGFRVQPFKCGPDYIDPIHHRTAAGRNSINLDRFLMSDTHIHALYNHYSSCADVSITEGVMGLFDGAKKSEGSSADLAKQLDLPVILILNAKAMAYSAAAILYGLKNFDKDLHIAGVIFNFVDSPSHYKILSAACEDVGLQPLGHLPSNKDLRIPSRHLGLDTADADTAIEAAARHIEAHLDLENLLQITQTSPRPTAPLPYISSSSWQILVARDAAFHFLYPQNIRQLEQWGTITYFSPLKDTTLPFQPDLLYLPGGYPELYLEALSDNTTLLRQIKTYNGRIIAECGGMMYLGESITDSSGKAWPMAGVLDIATTMQSPKLSIGYRTVQLNGQTLKGHEFHFSRSATSYPIADVRNVQNEPVSTPLFSRPGLLASYAHFYWGEDGHPIKTLLS